MNTATVKSAVSQLIAGKTTVAGFIQVASKEGVADALQSAIIAAHFADRSKSAENICAELGIETPAKQPAKRTRKQKPTTRKQSDNPKGCDSGKLWRELDGDNCADMVYRPCMLCVCVFRSRGIGQHCTTPWRSSARFP